jgi:hypothetical protein
LAPGAGAKFLKKHLQPEVGMNVRGSCRSPAFAGVTGTAPIGS